MAEVLLYRYEILQENASNAGWAVGDILDVFAETDDLLAPSFIEITGIYSKKNGVLVVTGDALLNKSPGVVSFNDYGATICKGTYLIQFNSEFFQPYYAFYSSLADHPSCAISPPTCNLMVDGIPEIVGASGELIADGYFTINASSTNAIEYKIGSTFVYGDGTGQSSPTFTALLPGTYNVFLRDSVNCATSVQVVVPVESNYGVRYRMEYDDYAGHVTRCDIVKRGYSGSISEVCASGTPLTIALRGEGSDDKFTSVISLNAVIEFTTESDSDYEEIFTNDPNLYRVYYYKDFGSGFVIQNTFKVLPQLFQADYKKAPFYVSINSTDGLAELQENFLVQDNGLPYFGTISLIKMISHCLSVLKLDLDILVACNLYAVESANIFDPSPPMDNGASDDPFDQAYIDFEAFYIAEQIPDLNFVLKSILDAFGCRLVQSDNRWNILRVEEMTGDIDYRLFDKNGDYVSNGTINVVSEIQFPTESTDILRVNADANFRIMPGFGSVRSIYHLGLRPNVLNNGNFRLKLFPVSIPGGNTIYVPQIDLTGWLLVSPFYTLLESYEQIDEINVAYKITGDASMINTIFPIPYLPNYVGGTAYIQSDEHDIRMGSNDTFLLTVTTKIISTWQSNFLIGLPSKIEVPYVRVRIMVTCDGSYLNVDGSWSTTESIMSFFTQDFDKYIDFQITANKPPTNGLLSVRVYHAYIYYAGYYQISDVEAIDTYDSVNAVQTTPTGYKLEIRENATYDKIHYYELQENTDSPSGYERIRPSDYNAGVNPRQWVRVAFISIDDALPPYNFSMCIDKVELTFLTNGKSPFDKIIRTKSAEPNNKLLFEKEFYIGSYSELITTEASFGLIGATLGNIYGGGGSLSLTTTSMLNASIVYAGWLRNADGEGFKYWKRDGIDEQDYLHGLINNAFAGQYKKSWRAMSGSYQAKTYFKFINVLKEGNDNDRLYLPMSLSLNDKRCELIGEAYELRNVYIPGEGGEPYSSGFTIGFGASSFN